MILSLPLRAVCQMGTAAPPRPASGLSFESAGSYQECGVPGREHQEFNRAAIQSFGGCRQDSSQTQVLTGAGGKSWQERGGHFLQVRPSPLPGTSASHLAVYNFSISNLPSGP